MLLSLRRDLVRAIKAGDSVAASAARDYGRLGHRERADRLREEAAVLSRHLPDAAS